MAYASQYETTAHFMEAWQRTSATQLRKKIVKTWTRIYVGIMTKAEADELLLEVLKFTNVEEAFGDRDASGMWSVRISFKLAQWVEPAVYIDG